MATRDLADLVQDLEMLYPNHKTDPHHQRMFQKAIDEAMKPNKMVKSAYISPLNTTHATTQAVRRAPLDMLLDRLGVDYPEGISLVGYRDDINGTPTVFAMVHGKPMILQDENANLFPSDAFVTKIRLLMR